MPEQYFTSEPTSGHAPLAVDWVEGGKALQFETNAGVFSRTRLDKGTELLLKSLPEAFSGRALDLGCGWGAVGVCMAARWPGAKIVMTDVNTRATGLSQKNLAQNGLSAEVYTGDGLSAVGGAFDLIALNPPIRAGKAVIYRLFDESAARLAAEGALYVVIRKQQGADSALAHLRTCFEDIAIIARGGGYRVFRCLKARG